jgi:hypothetical protein
MRNRFAAIGLALALATAAQAQVRKPAQPPSPLSAAHTADTPEPDESAQESAWDAYLRRVAEQLARSGSGRDLAFAAILTRLPPTSSPKEGAAIRSQAWSQAALERAGQDALAYQLLAAKTPLEEGALRDAASRRWLALEPGNFSALMQQPLGPQELLVAARESRYADMHMYEGVRWMQSAILRHPPTARELQAFGGSPAYRPEEGAVITAIGIWAAFALPGYKTLLDACKPEKLGDAPTREADCRHIAHLLVERSSSLLDQGVGLAVQRWLARTPAERAAVQARRRQLDWLMHASAPLSMQDGGARFVRLLSDPSIHSEQQLLERMLKDAGRPLQPPAGWKLPVPKP